MRGFGRRRGGRVFFVLLLFFLLVFFLVVINQKIAPIVETVAQTRAHLVVTRIVNRAVNNQLSQGIRYEDLMTVEKDKDDKVAFLQPNTVKINQLISSITLEVEGDLEDLSAEGVTIPAGLLSGLTIFANIGPNLSVTIQPIGYVNVSVADEFISVGFNQSKHSITLQTDVKLEIVMPFSKNVMEVNNSIPLVESIIVGPVPDTYFDWN